MKIMNKIQKCGIGYALLLLSFAAGASAQTALWTADFANASSTWSIVADPSGGSTISTVNGNQGQFYVDGADTMAAFIPNSGLSIDAPFVPANSANYVLDYTVSVWWSDSYDIVIDEFDSSGNYINTIGGVVPQTGNPGWNNNPPAGPNPATAYTVSLGGFTYDADAAYILPKVDVYTGAGGQTVTFSEMDISTITAVPEPCTFSMILAGVGGLLLMRRRRAR